MYKGIQLQLYGGDIQGRSSLRTYPVLRTYMHTKVLGINGAGAARIRTQLIENVT